jgi:hypothetical protein
MMLFLFSPLDASEREKVIISVFNHIRTIVANILSIIMTSLNRTALSSVKINAHSSTELTENGI